MPIDPLPRALFAAPTLAVARRLLGQRLVRRLDGELLVGRIVEAEAYGGTDDSTSHAYHGPRGRAKGMFGQVGRAYVYLIYGVHSCLNVVAHPQDAAGAVLIRALAPETGIDRMRTLRGEAPLHQVARGPGRLCAALLIDRGLEGVDLCDPASPLYLAAGLPVPDGAVSAGQRVGVRGRPEDMSLPWRLFITGDPSVSRQRSQWPATPAASSDGLPKPDRGAPGPDGL